MARLSLYLLGTYDITIDGEKIEGLYNQAKALLVYLVVESHRWHSRESLAAMLWPNEPEHTAKQNLRQAVSRLRVALKERDSGLSYIEATRTGLKFNTASDYTCDYEAFRSACCAGNNLVEQSHIADATGWMQEAEQYYRGKFLAHFSAEYSDPLREWIHSRAEAVKLEAVAVTEKLSQYYERQGDFTQAISAAHKLVDIEPWSEGPRHLLIRLLSESGNDVAALVQYESCCSMMRSELGVEPSQETVALFNRIKNNVRKNTSSSPSASLASAHERRHVTILSCRIDVPVLAEPSKVAIEVRRFTERCRDIAGRYGALPYSVSGDECTLCFGYPITEQNTEKVAVEAALAIQQMYSEQGDATLFKAGMATGDALVLMYKGAASPHLIGDPLTQADFLRHMAQGGECALCRTTKAHVDKQFQCTARSFSAGDDTGTPGVYYVLQGRLDTSTYANVSTIPTIV